MPLQNSFYLGILKYYKNKIISKENLTAFLETFPWAPGHKELEVRRDINTKHGAHVLSKYKNKM